jgi:antidote-toxin recognition MazE-like antitoxin
MASRSKRRAAPKRLSSRDKVRTHRKRLRARGLRPIQVWVPDTRTRAFKVEAHRQSLVVAQSPHARQDQDFIDTISLQPGD